MSRKKKSFVIPGISFSKFTDYGNKDELKESGSGMRMEIMK